MILPMSVLGVCGVGRIPVASAITPIPSLLSVVSVCPPIMPVSDPVYIPCAAPTVLMMSLPSLSVVSSLSAAIYLPGEVSTLVSGPAVNKKADIIRSCLPAEGHVRAGTVAEAVPFIVELNAELSAVLSLWACDSIPVGFSE